MDNAIGRNFEELVRTLKVFLGTDEEQLLLDWYLSFFGNQLLQMPQHDTRHQFYFEA